MRTLRDVLLAEAKEDKEERTTTPSEIPKIYESQWDGLGKGLSPGPIADEVKALLGIESAKGAVISGEGTAKIKAREKPNEFLADLGISKQNDFFKVMGQVHKSADGFSQFFEKKPPGRFMIESNKGNNKEKVILLLISPLGMRVLSKDTQLVRFYKFWIDSIVYAAMPEKGVKLSSKLSYKRDGNKLYVRCPE